MVTYTEEHWNVKIGHLTRRNEHCPFLKIVDTSHPSDPWDFSSEETCTNAGGLCKPVKCPFIIGKVWTEQKKFGY